MFLSLLRLFLAFQLAGAQTPSVNNLAGPVASSLATMGDLSAEQWQEKKGQIWHQMEFLSHGDNLNTAMHLDLMKHLNFVDKPSSYSQAFVLGFSEAYGPTVKDAQIPTRFPRPWQLYLLQKTVLEEAQRRYQPVHDQLVAVTSGQNFDSVANHINNRLSLLSFLAAELRDIKQEEKLMTDEDLLENSDYMEVFYQYKSCEISYFGSPSVAGTMANHPIPKNKAYLRERDRLTLAPNLPNLSPVDSFVDSRRDGVTTTNGSLRDHSMKLFEAQLNRSLKKMVLDIGEQLKKMKAQIADLEVELRKIETLGSRPKGKRGRHGPRYSDILDDTVETLARHPFELGRVLAQYKFSHLDSGEIFQKAHYHFQNERDQFANMLLVSGGMALSSLFIPGAVLLQGLNMSVRVATLVYASITLGQMTMVSQYIDRFYQENQRLKLNQLLSDLSGFHGQHASEIESGLWDGGLAMAFVGMGEILGMMKVGEGAVSKGLARFFHWGRKKGSELFNHEIYKHIRSGSVTINLFKKSTSEGVDGLINDKEKREALMQSLRGLPQILQQAKPTNRENFKRAKELVDWIQSDRNFQNHLSESLAKLSTEKERRLFLDATIENVFRGANVTAIVGAPKQAFREHVLKIMDDLFDTANETITLKSKIDSFLTQAENPVIKNFLDVQQSALDLKAILANPEAFGYAKDFATKAVARRMASSLKSKLRAAHLHLKASQTARNMTPFAVLHADDAKDLSLKLLDEAFSDPQVTRAFFQLPQLPEYTGYNMAQARYYFEKSIVVAEIIAEHLAQFGARSSSMMGQLKEDLIETLVKMDRAPVSIVATALELNGFLSRIVLKMRGQTTSEMEPHSLQATLPHIVDCSMGF